MPTVDCPDCWGPARTGLRHTFDPATDPEKYAKSFPIHSMA